MGAFQQLGKTEINPFTVVRTTTDGYQASSGDFVITDQPNVELPPPSAEAYVAIRADTQTRDVTITTPSGTIYRQDVDVFRSDDVPHIANSVGIAAGNGISVSAPAGSNLTELTGGGLYSGAEPVILVSDGVDWYSQQPESTIQSAIPDSAVLFAEAKDYDGSAYQSQIGPNVPDATGDPNLQTKTYRSQSIQVVEYLSGNSDFSQTTSLSLSDSRQAFILVLAERHGGVSSQVGMIDGGDPVEFEFFHAGPEHRIQSNDIDTRGGTSDTNLHVFVVDRDGGTLSLFKDDMSSALLSASGSPENVTGLSIGNRADEARSYGDPDVAVVEVLEGHTDSERDDEVARLKSEYNIP